MFGKIIWGILAILFWPITLSVGAVILIWAIWTTFFTTKDRYRAPRNEETGEELKSFLMGGEWDEEDPPHDEYCINAWMFLLSDAEDISEDDVERTKRLIDRAINILNFAGVDESNADFDATDSIVPDLIYHLRQSDAGWLETKLLSEKESLLFSLDSCLQAAAESQGISEILNDSQKQADEELETVRNGIPEYTKAEIELLAKQFATSMRANEQDLDIEIDFYETTSFSKRLHRFEWDGETVTERGLAHMSIALSFAADNIPTGKELDQRVWDEIFEGKPSNYDYDYGFLFSTTTSSHKGKDVHVIVDIDEAPEYYIWTVSEGSMDYDIYEETHEGKSNTEIIKVVFSTGDLSATFDIENSSSFQHFLEQLRDFRDELDEKATQLFRELTEQ